MLYQVDFNYFFSKKYDIFVVCLTQTKLFLYLFLRHEVCANTKHFFIDFIGFMSYSVLLRIQKVTQFINILS